MYLKRVRQSPHPSAPKQRKRPPDDGSYIRNSFIQADAPRNLPGCIHVLGDVFNGRTAWQDSKRRTHNLRLKTRRVANSICNPSPVLAESEGFEPPEPCGSTVFKTAAIDHSANFPETKVAPIFHSAKSPPRFYSNPANPELKFRR